jgi:hypothetical protein
MIMNSPEQQTIPDQQVLVEAIRTSRWILNLEENWDDAGSSGYQESTWERACNFLTRQSTLAQHKFNRELPVPKILPGPESSIDLHWKMPGFELLVNVPADPKKHGTFYGDDHGNLSIRGTLDTASEIKGMVVWLLN